MELKYYFRGNCLLNRKRLLRIQDKHVNELEIMARDIKHDEKLIHGYLNLYILIIGGATIFNLMDMIARSYSSSTQHTINYSFLAIYCATFWIIGMIIAGCCIEHENRIVMAYEIWQKAIELFSQGDLFEKTIYVGYKKYFTFMASKKQHFFGSHAAIFTLNLISMIFGIGFAVCHYLTNNDKWFLCIYLAAAILMFIVIQWKIPKKRYQQPVAADKLRS